jgi:hypothetical protein
MKNLTLLEMQAWRARRQANDALWKAYAQGISYSPWSVIDFLAWKPFVY